MPKLMVPAFAVAIGLVFSAGATAQNLSKAEYISGKDLIVADYKSASTACASNSGNAKDICMAEAKGRENVATAELEARFAPSSMNRYAVSIANTDSTSKKVAAKEYVKDSLITAKVKAAVFDEPSLNSAEINVETYKGMVQLSGFVRSRADINKAVAVARQVNGVTSVKNDMVVKGQQ